MAVDISHVFGVKAVSEAAINFSGGKIGSDELFCFGDCLPFGVVAYPTALSSAGTVEKSYGVGHGVYLCWLKG